MPKRKKHPRLPNSFGSIRYLGKNRKNPYAVHPPCTEISDAGDYIRPKALCYVRDWYVGFSVLMAYHAGTYEPGTEEQLQRQREQSTADLDAFCERILSDFSSHARIDDEKAKINKTFADVYAEFYERKFGENASRKLSKSAAYATRSAYKHCAILHGRIFSEITVDDLQECMDACELKEATHENIKALFNQMYAYARPRGYCEQEFGRYISISSEAEKDENGISLDPADRKRIWNLRYENEVAEMMVIMCYTGMRISEYRVAHLDLDRWCFDGGLKTPSGKNRVVPIHPAIRDLVKRRVERDGCVLSVSPQRFRQKMSCALLSMGITVDYKPHDCRHTFSALCEKYKVGYYDQKRIMGHKIKDITHGTYGHRTLEDLEAEIEKIPAGF